MIAPCKDCERRSQGCHSKCDEYKEYAESREKAKKDKQRYWKNNEAAWYFAEHVKKERKK